jgi:hypothetical protein
MESELHVFTNRLRILIGLDQHEVAHIGRLSEAATYEKFADDPFRFLMRCDDPTAEAIWAVVQQREVRS